MTRTDVWRIAGCALGFAFGAVWTAAGMAAAFGSLAFAAFGLAVVEVVRRRSSASGIASQLAGLRGRVSTPTVTRPRPAPARKPRRARHPDWPSQESRYGW